MPTPNDLWSRNGATPILLPEGTLYDETHTGWSDLANNEDGRIALGFVKAPDYPDHDAETEMVVWNDDGTGWAVVDRPEAPEAPEPEPNWRIGKYWLLRRRSPSQVLAYKQAAYEATHLTPAQMANPASAREAMLFQFSIYLELLEGLSVIELNVIETVQAFHLMRLLGIFGADPDSAEALAAMEDIMRPAEPYEAA